MGQRGNDGPEASAGIRGWRADLNPGGDDMGDDLHPILKSSGSDGGVIGRCPAVESERPSGVPPVTVCQNSSSAGDRSDSLRMA